MIWDIAVIGGGASGLIAALTAAGVFWENGRPASIIILERMNRMGKKLLATGNGRCNLTNRNVSPSRYHGDTEAAAPLLSRFTPEAAITLFQKLGLLCREQEGGRVYPYNLQAAAVLETLQLHLERMGAVFRCDFPADGMEPLPDGHYRIRAGGEFVCARRVIAATGGKAAPRLGSDGSGYALVKSLGHSVTPLFPSLAPLATEPRRVRPLKGMRCRASVSLLDAGKPVQRAEGEVQFTGSALSGICVFDLSHPAADLLSHGKCPELSLNLMPEYAEKEIFRILRNTAQALPNLPGADLAGGLLNRLVGREVISTALRGRNCAAVSLKNTDIAAICRTIRDFRFPVTGLMPWDSAQVTAGGVPLSEIDPDRMESRLAPGLFLAGELLNIDGGCGGFNLHWAWASGIAAGHAAARSLLEP